MHTGNDNYRGPTQRDIDRTRDLPALRESNKAAALASCTSAKPLLLRCHLQYSQTTEAQQPRNLPRGCRPSVPVSLKERCTQRQASELNCGQFLVPCGNSGRQTLGCLLAATRREHNNASSELKDFKRAFLPAETCRHQDHSCLPRVSGIRWRCLACQTCFRWLLRATRAWHRILNFRSMPNVCVPQTTSFETFIPLARCCMYALCRYILTSRLTVG